MGKPNDVKDEFARLLKEGLLSHFGKMPAVAVVTREFNLRAHGVEPVTQESVRRWLKGISMPEERKLRILVTWLKLDLSRCFGGTPNGSDGADQPGRGGVKGGAGNKTADGKADGKSDGRGDGKGDGTGDHRLFHLISTLPEAEKRMLEQLAETLAQVGRNRRKPA